MRRGGALRHPDRSAPRLGSRFAVATGHLCQIKFWLMQLMEQCGERGTINSKRFGNWLRALHNQVHDLTRMEGDNEVPDGSYRITITARSAAHGNRWKLELV